MDYLVTQGLTIQGQEIELPVTSNFTGTVGLGCYAGWNLCTYVPYASDGSLDSPDQCKHFDTSLPPSNRRVKALGEV